MFRLLWAVSVPTRYYLRRYLPTNILLDLIRSRRGLKWGVPAMLLAVPYLLVASTCTSLLAGGGPAWLNLLVLLCAWNSMKLTLNGPVTVILLLRDRTREAAAWRRARRVEYERRVSSPKSTPDRLTRPERDLFVIPECLAHESGGVGCADCEAVEDVAVLRVIAPGARDVLARVARERRSG